MKARMSQLHKTEAEWLELKNWKPEIGELIVYDPDENHEYSRIKIGDGQRALQDLPFYVETAIETLMQRRTIDAGRIC